MSASPTPPLSTTARGRSEPPLAASRRVSTGEDRQKRRGVRPEPRSGIATLRGHVPLLLVYTCPSGHPSLIVRRPTILPFSGGRQRERSDRPARPSATPGSAALP